MTRTILALLLLATPALAQAPPQGTITLPVALPATVPSTSVANVWVQRQDTWTNGTSATTGTTWTPTGWQSSYAIALASGAITIAAPVNLTTQTTFYSFTITEPATGAATVYWASYYKWPGGVAPTFANGPNAVSEVMCKATGASAHCNVVGENYK